MCKCHSRTKDPAARKLEEHSGPTITEAMVRGGAPIPNAFQQNIPVSITTTYYQACYEVGLLNRLWSNIAPWSPRWAVLWSRECIQSSCGGNCIWRLSTIQLLVTIECEIGTVLETLIWSSFITKEMIQDLIVHPIQNNTVRQSQLRLGMQEDAQIQVRESNTI